ncbi:MAG: acetolactate decarboxylase [Selenomonadaceae bacterium]|nr:acetolactate decarboxylase [Selenomonadaceae bacterium]
MDVLSLLRTRQLSRILQCLFDQDRAVKLKDIKDKAAFEKILNEEVQNLGANSFYMVKLHAEFESVLFRSEYGSKEPYPTLVGLYCPSYMGELNSVGWHFHFLSDDKKKSGHILELSLGEGVIYLDKTDKFTMILHDDKKFHDINLAKDMTEDIRRNLYWLPSWGKMTKSGRNWRDSVRKMGPMRWN